MERDEMLERIARALHAHHCAKFGVERVWEQEHVVFQRQHLATADVVLAALSGVPATTCTECGGTGGGPVRVSGDEWELQECGVCGGMGYVPAPTEPAEPWWKKAAREADLRELPPLCHPGGGAPTEPPGPITLRYDVEIRTADGALLAGWLDLPTGAHDQEQADEIRRNIFRLDWSDARIEDIRHRPAPTEGEK